jgi:hypothetical protein
MALHPSSLHDHVAAYGPTVDTGRGSGAAFSEGQDSSAVVNWVTGFVEAPSALTNQYAWLQPGLQQNGTAGLCAWLRVKRVIMQNS